MIEGKYVRLRSLEMDDLPILKMWRNQQHVRKSTREYKLLNMINQKNWFHSIHQNNPPREIMFGVMDKKNNLVGVTGLTYIDWKNRHAEISIFLSKVGWQKTREACDALQLILKYGFGELNLHRLWVEIFSTMPKNIQLFSKMKFVPEGKLRQKLWRSGKWWDSDIYSILSDEFHDKK